MLDLTVLILAINEADNLRGLLPGARRVLNSLKLDFEILVIDGGSSDDTVEVARREGARVVHQKECGYGKAFKEGASESKGRFVICLDADCSHPPELIACLWEERHSADLIVASRYIEGGKSLAPAFRVLCSKLLNFLYMKALSLPIKDLSSGFRLYRRDILTADLYTGSHFDILIEAIVRAICAGYATKEIPFVYQPRLSGNSHAKLFRFGAAYLKQFVSLWSLRNSIESADYDDRAYDSRIPPQRYWQTRRFALVMGFLGNIREKILDVGCGTSRIIQNLPNAIAADIAVRKLRFLRKTNPFRICLSTFDLPFADRTFDALIHSEVLEHISPDERVFTEINRVLRPGGVLIVGTPDYGRIWWPIIEFFYERLLPKAHAQEHITHYTKQRLLDLLEKHDFKIEDYAYICAGELIIKATKL